MKLRRMTPVVLAATVALTGVTGAFLSSMVPAHAITSVDELSDVNRNHWAFDALRDLVEKYIQVKPHVLAIVDAFENESMQGCRMLGVHMRGTDKGAAIASDETNRKVGPAAYYEEIDQYIAKHDDCRIFVATDQEQYLEAMTERYPERVLSRDAQRSNDDLNTFQKAEGDAYKKGEEALIDCLLLSRCDFLLKCTSHLSESSMYFNPKLECIDMNYVK